MTEKLKNYIDKSVLCWLATVSKNMIPNVSPKEVFTYYNDKIIIANIASPNSVNNIKQNKNVCVSFIDILVQKGYQVKGSAEVINKRENVFAAMEKKLLKITEGKFPFSSIIVISIISVKAIIAPKYIFYPETTEEEQIESAKKTYGF